MATVKFVQAQKFSLAGSGATIADTTIILQSMLGIDGVAITTTDIGVKGFGTLEPGNGVQEEQISFTGITQNANGTATLTGVKTVAFISPYTETSGIAKTHAGATTFILSNDAGFYGQILDYIDTAIVSGGVPATTTVLGLNKMSVAPVSAASPIAVSDNDPRMLTASLASSVGYVTAPAIVSRYATASGAAPTGYLRADGSAVSRATYSGLYSVLSSSYGAGDGSTTFNLPNPTINSMAGGNSYASKLVSASSMYLSRADTAALSIISDITFTCDINFTTLPSASTMCFASKFLSTGNQQSYAFTIVESSGFTLAMQVSTTGSNSVNPAAAAWVTPIIGKWYHLAWSYTAATGTVIYYVDGMPIGTGASGGTSIFDSTAAFEVGAWNPAGTRTNFLNGNIANVKIFAAALTQTQIINNMLYVNSNTPAASWNLNNTYLDTSGNGLTLTANGSPTFVQQSTPDFNTISIIKT